MMNIITSLFDFVFSILAIVLSPLSFAPELFNMIDMAFSFLITLFYAASWFLPLDVIAVCITAIFVVDNFALIFRIIRWVISLIPTIGGS